MKKLDPKLKNELRKKAESDIKRLSKTTPTDSKGHKFKWDKKDRVFKARDEKSGKEWLKGVDSEVAGYWWYCPNIIGQTYKGYNKYCYKPHFVFLYQHGDILNCTGCKLQCTIDLGNVI